MIIETSNDTFEVEFNHNIVPNHSKVIGKKETRSKYPKRERSSTVAKLFKLDYSTTPPKRIMVDYAEAYCSEGDNFSKAVGRRTAMKRLFEYTNLERNQVVSILQTYFEMHNDPKNAWQEFS